MGNRQPRTLWRQLTVRHIRYRPIFYTALFIGVVVLTVFRWPAIAMPSAPPFLPNQHPTHSLLANPAPLTQAAEPSAATGQRLQQGRVAYEASRFGDAIAHWQTALTQLERQENPLLQATLLTNLALAHRQLGQWSDAQRHVEQGIALFQPVGDNRGDHASHADSSTLGSDRDARYWRTYGRLFNTQGIIHWNQGNLDAALGQWQHAIEIYAQAHYVPGQIASLINQSRALQSMGLMTQSRLTLDEAFRMLETQPDPLVQALGLRNLGNVLWHTGQLQEAADALETSLNLAETSATNQSETILMLGGVERSLANRAKNVGDRAAEGHLEKALHWYEQVAEIGASPIIQAKAQINALILLVDQQEWERATTLAEAIAPQLDTLPPVPSTLFIQLNHVQALAEITVEKASSSLTEARSPLLTWPNITQRAVQIVQQAQHLNNPRLESHSWGQLGHVYEQHQQWSQAETATREALNLAKTIHASDIQYRWEWQLGRVIVAKADTDAPLGLSSKDEPNKYTALVTSEDHAGDTLPTQAINFYNDAVETLKVVRKDLLFTDADVQFSFRDNVEPLYRQYVDILTRSPQPPETSLRKATELIDALQLAELENFLQCDIGQLVQLQQEQATIAPDTAVIYPMLLDDRLEVVLLTTDQIQRETVPVSRAKVEAVSQDLRRLLPVASRRFRAKRETSKLYEWLIRPWETQIEIDQSIESGTIKTLVFVLDGNLKSVPMAALWDHQRERYLLERYAIAVVPSLTIVDPQPLKRPIRVLAAGSTETLDHPFQDRPFTPLKNVGSELEGIDEQLPTETLLNDDFTQARLKEELGNDSFSILHLATHGEFSSDPSRTFVVLSDKPLYARELEDLLRLNVDIQTPLDMIVLSACQTATGDNRAALGMAGLTIRAGARSSLATLWSVDDLSAATLMQEFYAQLATHPDISRAEALRRAQLHLWEADEAAGKDWESQHFWSPYILVGNWL